MADNEVEEEFNITLIDPTKLDEEERKAQRLLKINKQVLSLGNQGILSAQGKLSKLVMKNWSYIKNFLNLVYRKIILNSYFFLDSYNF